MGSKQLNLDIAVAKATASDRVSNVRRGDSEGEVVFTFHHELLHQELDIQALCCDESCYPDKSEFIIFTLADDLDADVLSALEKLGSCTQGKLVPEIVNFISDQLVLVLENPICQDEMFFESNGSGSEFEADSDAEEYDMEMDNPTAFKQTTATASLMCVWDSKTRNTLKMDLKVARAAGVNVGLLSSNSGPPFNVVSLSARVDQLGISTHALEAWGLSKTGFIVLLIRFYGQFPRVSENIDQRNFSQIVQFKFGKCSTWKPSSSSAYLALDGTQGEEDGLNNRNDEFGCFVSILMSNSINALMNGMFWDLVRHRRARGLSWDEALLSLNSLISTTSENCDNITSQRISTSDFPKIVTPVSLLGDNALDTENNFSISLVSIQFAIHKLVNCTKCCMVCHQRVEGGFEAVKPYVCSNPLCLYQYLHLGIGVSIEHEVINNPFVVDLLVSFFYVAVMTGSKKALPTGLNLKTVVFGSCEAPEKHCIAKVCFGENQMKFEVGNFCGYQTIRPGDWVIVVLSKQIQMLNGPISHSHFDKYFCRITSASAAACNFEVMVTQRNQYSIHPASCHTNNTTQESLNNWQDALVFQYSHYVDDLETADVNAALTMIASTIPSILEMRSFLIGKPGRCLHDWDQMNKDALTLLRWIVASNTSFVIQESPVPEQSSQDENDVVNHETTEHEKGRVRGMHKNWMQFRFLQGSPEKEQAFAKALQSQRESHNNRPPTLFAWHGSALSNWHSIIRTGLNFDEISHGRAYGNGVYLSREFKTSSSYASRFATPVLPTVQAALTTESAALQDSRLIFYWPNSQLRLSSAIGICEVINRQECFVSCNPHWVVDNIEWIQCRYLFADVQATEAAQGLQYPSVTGKQWLGYVKQEEMCQLQGPNSQPIHIPLLISQEEKNPDRSQPKRRRKSVSPTLKDNEVEDDIERFLGDEDFKDNATVEKSSSTNGFKPGTLDLKSMPKLPLPSWAQSSPAALKSLTRDIKELKKTQTQNDIVSLGWYVDFDSIDNLFHLIVELHSFDSSLPLAQDMKKNGCTSIVLELRFGASYPLSPPFVRVVRPRFLPFSRGGGGHVTAGGAICSEMLTNSGWSPVMGIEKVLLQIRVGLCDVDPPARLDWSRTSSSGTSDDYTVGEAAVAYRRAAEAHGWEIPTDLRATIAETTVAID